MNIPAGKIAIGLFVIIVIILAVALTQGGQGTAPSTPFPSPEPTPTPIPTPSPPPSPSPTPSTIQKDWEITNLRYKITEKSDNYWYFSWQATLTNNTSSGMEFFVYVNFVDKDGFIIDYAIETFTLNPMEQKSIKGSEMIKAELASDVKRIELGDVSAYTRD